MGNSILPTSLTWVIREAKPRVRLRRGRIYFKFKKIFKSSNVRPERQKKGPQPKQRFFSSSNNTRFIQLVPSVLWSQLLRLFLFLRKFIFTPWLPSVSVWSFPRWLSLRWEISPAGTPINYWCISGLCSAQCCWCCWCSSSDVDFIFSAIDTAAGTKTSLIKPVVIGGTPSPPRK